MRIRIPALASFLLFAACGGGGDSTLSGDGPLPTPGPGNGGTVLSQPRNCEELLDGLRADALAKVAVQAANLRREADSEWGERYFDGPMPVPEAGGGDAEAGPGLSETNVQEVGVDEADQVETADGWIHVLHGAELLSFSAEAPEALALVTRTPLAGNPISMFVEDGRAVVFSSDYEIAEQFGTDGSDCGGIGRPLPEPAVSTLEGEGMCAPAWTRVQVVELEAGEPFVVREFALRGYFSAARRHGDVVRLAVTGGLGTPAGLDDFWAAYWSGPGARNADEFLARVDAWEKAAGAAIDASRIEDWLPVGLESQDGATWDLLPPACADVALPPRGTTGHGMTRLLSFDFRDDRSEVSDVRILGAAQRLYANLDYVLLAQDEWGWAERSGSNRVYLHLFRIGEGNTGLGYVDSATVDGVPHDQFSFDIEGDIARVSTTVTLLGDDRVPDGESMYSQVHTLRIGADSLERLGETAALAPGERIYATRFVGDTGYLVTFRQIDPLFVIDLADPARPTVLGELELPGFSDYIQPLDADHLLTVGRAGDASGRIDGVALRIFDVSDPTDPLLQHEFVPGNASWTAASSDHHLFTFREEDGLLALPMEGAAPDWASALHLFAVDTERIEALGTIQHGWKDAPGCGVFSPLPPGSCRRPPPMMRRGLFGGDFVYSISVAALEAHALDTLDVPIAQVYLADPFGGAAPGGLLD